MTIDSSTEAPQPKAQVIDLLRKITSIDEDDVQILNNFLYNLAGQGVNVSGVAKEILEDELARSKTLASLWKKRALEK